MFQSQVISTVLKMISDVRINHQHTRATLPGCQSSVTYTLLGGFSEVYLGSALVASPASCSMSLRLYGLLK